MFGGELRLLMGFLAHCDHHRHDPSEPLVVSMTLEELANIARGSKASAGRWRSKLRDAGYLQYDDQSGKT